MTNLQELPLAGAMNPASIAPDIVPETLGAYPPSAAPVTGDRIRQLFAQPSQQTGAGGAWGMLGQLVDFIQQMLGMTNAANSVNGPQTYFQNANASSTGDPHLAFNGTTGSGQNQTARIDSMSGHRDLLDSDSMTGGFRISTSTTQPGANGVTYNRRAAVSTDFGGTQVSLDDSGDAYVTQAGRQFALAPGTSYDLGNGESVTRNANGSVAIDDVNASGGSITTTLSENGSGVDVNVQARDVDLGGDLTSASAPAVQTRRGRPVRWNHTAAAP